MIEKQDQRLDPERAGDGGVRNHRREGARRAADDDVLRRRPLEPHRVDDGVEEDREGQEAGREPVRHEAKRQHRADRERHAEGERLAAADPARRDRPLGRAGHHRVDVGIPPHVERTGRAGAHRDRHQRGESDDGVHRGVDDDHTDERGENHEEHHTRLEQRQETRRPPPSSRRWRSARGWAAGVAGAA